MDGIAFRHVETVGIDSGDMVLVVDRVSSQNLTDLIGIVVHVHAGEQLVDFIFRDANSGGISDCV